MWLDVLGKLKNIYFEDCEFHCTKLALNHAATWYEGCKFSQPWFVTMGKNPEGLVERGDSLYNACEFSQGVSLYGDDADETTLGLYGIVFQDCKMTSLYVNSMNLTARLYVAPVEPADVFKPDRHGTPKALENFQVTSTVFKKAFDLSRLHFGEIQFSGCTFEEGVDLSGLVCDRLGLDSCNVNGRFSLDHAHTKKVGFKDCHFKRSVILDAGTYQALLFNASSFEQVLSLEFAEIADYMGIGSCSMSKPPNFLNCQLGCTRFGRHGLKRIAPPRTVPDSRSPVLNVGV